MKFAGYLLIAYASTVGLASASGPRDLAFEDRVRAQEAIERVYFSHQIGTTKPFEQAVPKAVLAGKVHRYLEQSAALRSRAQTVLTDEMLERELARMARASRMPDRLLELYAALGNDPFLIKECLARPTLVERLTRSLVASGETSRRSRNTDRTDTVAVEGGTLPLPTSSPSSNGLPCEADDTWNGGVLDDVPEARWYDTGVWTGSLFVVWGGNGGFQSDGSLNTGGRYDPATDSWSPTSLVGAPAPRVDHTAVWTGSLMIVWGGNTNGAGTRTGGRYDPVSDTWTPTSMTGAPSNRQYHSAVWTGSLMIIWGGFNTLSTGARYDPVTDTWTPTTTTGAAFRRGLHTAIWTGTEMIVWGGSYEAVGYRLPLNSGGRYNPATDTWDGTSLIGAPSERDEHVGVWTGSRMVVWGGSGANTGGIYNPATNTWEPTILGGAPSPRSGASAVWTGSRMVVWGGRSPGSATNTGGRFDPVSNTWTPMTTTGAPPGTMKHASAWTGSLMLVWGGGTGAGATDTGGRYDPATDLWTPIAASSAPPPRTAHSAVWTGNEMLVWGGSSNGGAVLNTGGRYNPATDSWTPMATTGAPSARRLHTAVWTGHQMVVWGGNPVGADLNTGGRYDPVTDTWTPTSMSGVPIARSEHVAVWTGSLMVVTGGQIADPRTGGRYNPVSDSWTPTSLTGAPSDPHQTAAWTGSLMLVWGGVGDNALANTGARYDPVANVWTPTSTIGAPSTRSRHTAVWTGGLMLVWGGYGYDAVNEVYHQLNDGGRYDPVADTWSPVSMTGAPSARWRHTAVWTGSRMVVWGGLRSVTNPTDGGRYDPASDTWAPVALPGAPSPRANHTAVWTGSLMIVFGGDGGGVVVRTGGRYVLGASIDDDGDGYSECQSDCNDANATIHPGAVEACNALDDDCNGLVDDGVAGRDPDSDGLASACDDCPTSYDPAQSDFDHDGQGDLCDVDDGVIYILPLDKNYRDWQPEAGETAWNSYRGSLAVLRATGQYTQAPGSNPLAARDCGLGSPSVFDPLVPTPGDVAFHLVTAVTGGVEGGLGTSSAGSPRPNANPCP